MESGAENHGANLESVFHSYCSGKNEMSSKEFLKLNKDCGLIDKNYTLNDVDIYFVKLKDKSSKNINYSQFEGAIKLISSKKGVSFDDLVKQICSKGGAKYTGTKADYVKFHDDKSLYTGVYAKGGPTNFDASTGKISDISQLCDRTKADVRGVKK